MKIEFKTDEQVTGLLRDLLNGIVVSRLLESIENCKYFNKHPEDKRYNRQYKAAAKIVIEHFAGKS